MEGVLSAVFPPRVARATSQSAACLSPAGEAAPAARSFYEKEAAPVPAASAEESWGDSIPSDIQELLMELVWYGHPVSLWRGLRVLSWLLPTPSGQERVSCLLALCEPVAMRSAVFSTV